MCRQGAPRSVYLDHISLIVGLVHSARAVTVAVVQVVGVSVHTTCMLRSNTMPSLRSISMPALRAATIHGPPLPRSIARHAAAARRLCTSPSDDQLQERLQRQEKLLQQEKLIASLVGSVGSAADKEVPWFLDQMPPAYFRQVAPARREEHLRSITALSAQGIRVPEVQLRDTEGKGFTFIGDGMNCNLNRVVQRQLQSMPEALGMRRVLIFQSLDGRLGIQMYDTFDETKASEDGRFGAPGGDAAVQDAEAAALEKIEAMQAVRQAGRPSDGTSDLIASYNFAPPPLATPGGAADALSLSEYLSRCPSSYVIGHGPTPGLLFAQKALYEAVGGGDDMAVALHRYAGIAESTEANNALLTLAIPQTTARKTLQRAIHLLNLHGLEIQRCQVDNVRRPGSYDVALLRTVVRPLGGELTQAQGAALARDAARLKHVSDWSFGLAISSNGGMSLLEAEVALGLADLSLALLDHPLLSKARAHTRVEPMHGHPPPDACACTRAHRSAHRVPRARACRRTCASGCTRPTCRRSSRRSRASSSRDSTRRARSTRTRTWPASRR